MANETTIPCDIESEGIVLGTLIIDRRTRIEKLSTLNEEDFYRPEHGILFRAAHAIGFEGEPIDDVVKLKNAIIESGQCNAFGGVEKLRDWIGSIWSTPSNFDYYLARIKAATARRRAIMLGERIKDAAMRDIDEVRHIIESSKNEIDAITNAGHTTHHDLCKIVRFDDIEPTEIEWLWPGRIAIGKVSIIAGNPGLGKSFLTIDITARVSRGDGWPDAAEAFSEPGDVVLLTAEDDPADTIRPRLDAAGADVTRVATLETLEKYDPIARRKHNVPLNIGEHLESIEATIKRLPNPRLLIIDPISAFLGKTDSHNNAEVRAVLAPLSQMAARLRVAVLCVSHMNKGNGDAISRVMGSLGFVAAARAAFVVVKDQGDPSRRLFLVAKNNIGPDSEGLAYRLMEDATGWKVAWEEGTINAHADEILDAQRQPVGRPSAARNDAADRLWAFLATPQTAKDVYGWAHSEGISKNTLNRAKVDLEIVSSKDKFNGEWIWKRPEQ